VTPLQVPGGIEILVILLVLLFNFVVIALVVLGIVFLSRRWGGADESELDALRDRVADLEAQVEALAARGDEAAGDEWTGDDR